MADKRRLAWLDIAKGASILLVVFLHAATLTEEYQIDAIQGWVLNELLRPVRMPVFFLISGMLARSALDAPWPLFLKRKLLLFIYLLVLWTAIRHLFYALFGDVVPEPFGTTDPSVVITTLVDPPNEIWFIWALGLFFLTARLLRGFLPLVALGLSALSILGFSGFVETDSVAYSGVVLFAPFFFLGLLSADTIVRVVAGDVVPKTLLAGGAFALLFILGARTDGIVHGVLAFLLCIVGAAMACMAARIAAESRTVREVFVYFGRNTLVIYLAHMLPMSILATASVVLLSEGVRFVLLVPLLVVGSVAASLVIKAWADRLGADWLYALPKRSVTREST